MIRYRHLADSLRKRVREVMIDGARPRCHHDYKEHTVEIGVPISLKPKYPFSLDRSKLSIAVIMILNAKLAVKS